MTDEQKRVLIIEHAKLVAARVSGNQAVLPRIAEIEAALGMDSVEIAEKAVRLYLSDY